MSTRASADLADMPATVEARIADHRAQTYADSVMYREVLADVARTPWTVEHRLAAAAALAALGAWTASR